MSQKHRVSQEAQKCCQASIPTMAGTSPGVVNSKEMALWWLAPAAAGKSRRERNKAAGKNLSVSLMRPDTLWFPSLWCGKHVSRSSLERLGC